MQIGQSAANGSAARHFADVIFGLALMGVEGPVVSECDGRLWRSLARVVDSSCGKGLGSRLLVDTD